jgi:YgiT-type zinc finger domain-containing protein
MKSRFIYLVILVAGLMLAGATNNMVYSQTKETKAKLKTVKYTCPTHSEVVMDMPGKCPKCGMQLVEKTNMKQMAEPPAMKNDKSKMKKEPAAKKTEPMLLPDTTTKKP